MSENREVSSRGFLLNLIRKIIPSRFCKQTITEEELRNALLEGEKSGVVESEERTMVEGVFYLGDKPVRAFMSHRSEIIWLDIEAGPDEARKVIDDSGDQMCFPVVSSGDLDEIRGVVLLRDLFRALLGESWPGLKSIMKAPYFVPETMSALKAFEAFKKADGTDLFVIDEYGGFAGVLSVSNLVSEIVGELSSPSVDDDDIVEMEDGSYLVDGGVSIDEVAQVLELESLGEEQNDYHTLAGFILYLAGEIPPLGAFFDYEGYRLTIVDIDGNRIDKIMVSKNKPPV